MKRIFLFSIVVALILTITSCTGIGLGEGKNNPRISAIVDTPQPSTSLHEESLPDVSILPETSDHNFHYAVGFMTMLQKPLVQVERLLSDAKIPYEVDDHKGKNVDYSSISLTLQEGTEPMLEFEFYLDETLQFRLGLISFENSYPEEEALQNAVDHFNKEPDVWKDDSGMIYYEFPMDDGTYYTLSDQTDKVYSFLSTFPLDLHSPLEVTGDTFSIMPELAGVVITNGEGECALDYRMRMDPLMDEISKLGVDYIEAIRAYSENISFYGDNSIATSSGEFCLTLRSNGEWEISLNSLSFKLFNLVGTGDSVDTLYCILGRPYYVTYNESTGYWLQYRGKIDNQYCMVGIGVSESKIIGERLRLDFIPDID